MSDVLRLCLLLLLPLVLALWIGKTRRNNTASQADGSGSTEHER